MLRVISLGAGVQSSTMAMMADRGLFGDRPDFAIFADTGNEPKKVYTWLKWLVAQLSFPVHILTPSVDLKTDAESMLEYRKGARSGTKYWRNLLPYFSHPIASKGQLKKGSSGMMSRKCTRNYKIRRIIKLLRESVDPDKFRDWRRIINPRIREAKKTCPRREGEKKKEWVGRYMSLVELPLHLVESWIGISVDEATRMKPSRDAWIRHRWPLVDLGMSRADCLEWMQRAGLPTPPKSSCTFCPYHSDAQWLELKQEDPEAFQEAVEHERTVQELARRCPSTKALPFLHKSLRPLDSINFEDRRLEDGQLSLLDWFDNECTGSCGL